MWAEGGESIGTLTRISLLLTVIAAGALAVSGCGSDTPGVPSSSHAHADDPAGDIRPYTDSQPPYQFAACDLRSADIASDGKTLIVELTSAAPIPREWPISDPASGTPIARLAFGVFFYLPDGGSFNVRVTLTKSGWHGSAPVGADQRGEWRSLDGPQVSGDVITFTIPEWGTARLADGFRWSAFAAFSFADLGDQDAESYGDLLPGVFPGNDTGDETLPFPT